MESVSVEGDTMVTVVHHHGPSPGADRPPLVLLHGFPLDSQMWAEVIAELPQIPVLAVDLPGFGAAREAAEPDGATLESFADAVVGALRDAGISRAVVAGLSMGGYVLMALAQRHADLLAGVGLLDTKAGEDTVEARTGRLSVANRALGPDGAQAVAGMIEGLLGPTSRAERSEVVEQVRHWLAQAPPEGIAGAQRAMATRPDRLAVLQTLQVPALVLYGSEDALAGAEAHEAMARALGTEPVVVQGAGHLSAVEEPAAVAEALAQLYQRSI
ncbi:alpha/beta fold hydrolase [Pseudactinotalea sp. Z1739]|uniref:alpha/beta fold hydrolase n=1 Tax=Pseudactinotalea sp. Z1739 TaxID=3413028 RepID=UPI003C7E2E6B